MQEPILSTAHPTMIFKFVEEYRKQNFDIDPNDLWYVSSYEAFFTMKDGVLMEYVPWDGWKPHTLFPSILGSNASFKISDLLAIYENIKDYAVYRISDGLDYVISFYVDMSLYKDVPEADLSKVILADNLHKVMKAGVKIEHMKDKFDV